MAPVEKYTNHGFGRVRRIDPVEPPDGVVDQILGEMIALLGRSRLGDRCRAPVKHRIVLVRLAVHEPVEVFEPPRPYRSASGRTGPAGEISLSGVLCHLPKAAVA